MAESPAVLAELPPKVLAQFEADWKASSHRRPKCSKADFAAGWRTAMERNWWKGRVRKPASPTASQDEAQEDSDVSNPDR